MMNIYDLISIHDCIFFPARTQNDLKYCVPVSSERLESIQFSMHVQRQIIFSQEKSLNVQHLILKVSDLYYYPRPRCSNEFKNPYL